VRLDATALWQLVPWYKFHERFANYTYSCFTWWVVFISLWYIYCICILLRISSKSTIEEWSHFKILQVWASVTGVATTAKKYESKEKNLGSRVEPFATWGLPLFWDVTQRWLVISYRRFVKVYWSRKVGNYQSTLCNIPEERRPHL